MENVIKSISFSVDSLFDGKTVVMSPTNVLYEIKYTDEWGDHTEDVTLDVCLEYLEGVEDKYTRRKGMDSLKSAIGRVHDPELFIPMPNIDREVIALKEKALETLAKFRKEHFASIEELLKGRSVKKVTFTDCFQWEDYNYPYGCTVTFTDGSTLSEDHITIYECCNAIRILGKFAPHFVKKAANNLENVIYSVYSHDSCNTKFRYRHEDLEEVEAVEGEIGPFPYVYEEGHNQNSFVVCKNLDGEIMWRGSRDCASGLVDIYRMDRKHYNGALELLKDTIENGGIYRDHFLTSALGDVEKAEKDVAEIKAALDAYSKSRPDYKGLSADITSEGELFINVNYVNVKKENSKVYGYMYYGDSLGFSPDPKEYHHFSEMDHLQLASDQLVANSCYEYEPFFDRLVEIAGKDKVRKNLNHLLEVYFGKSEWPEYLKLLDYIELKYISAKLDGVTPSSRISVLKKKSPVEFSDFAFTLDGKEIGYEKIFVTLPKNERKSAWMTIVEYFRTIPPHIAMLWYERFVHLYHWSFEDRFERISNFLSFEVDVYNTFENYENKHSNGCWKHYFVDGLKGTIKFSETLNKKATAKYEYWDGSEITAWNLQFLYRHVLTHEEFWSLYESIQRLREYVGKEEFANLPFVFSDPLEWAPAGSYKVRTPEFTGYVEPLGNDEFNIVNCDPCLEVSDFSISIILDAIPKEILEAAENRILKTGWSGTIKYYEDSYNWRARREDSGAIHKSFLPYRSNMKGDSMKIFLPSLLINYKGWKILQGNKDDIREITVTKKDTAGLNCLGIYGVMRKLHKKALIQQEIDRALREVNPEYHGTDTYESLLDKNTWGRITKWLEGISDLNIRKNFTLTFKKICKEVINYDLWSVDVMKMRCDSYLYRDELPWKGIYNCDFRDRTITYKQVVNGKIEEVKKVVKITPADRVRDIVAVTGISREDTIKRVVELWHRYKFTWQTELEFPETCKVDGREISVRKNPVKVSIPRWIEVPARSFYGNNLDCSFASGSLYYLCSSLLKLTSYTKLSEFYEMVKQHVTACGTPTAVTDYTTASSGYFRLEVNQEKIHRFLINHGIWHLNNSHVAEAKTIYKTDGEHTWAEKDVRITNPRSVEVINLVDFDEGWGSDDKLRFWDRAFTMCDHPVVLSFPSREVMRIDDPNK